MGNRVYIETNKSSHHGGYEFQVYDDYLDTDWFDLIEDEPSTPEALVHACAMAEGNARVILNEAAINDTRIETPLGGIWGSQYAAYVQQIGAQKDAKQLDQDTQRAPTSAVKRRI